MTSPIALVCAALGLCGVHGIAAAQSEDASTVISALANDDQCAADDVRCTISALQLRGQKVPVQTLADKGFAEQLVTLESGADSDTFPANSKCRLGQGFDLDRGCSYPAAMDTMGPCSKENVLAACKGSWNRVSSTSYTRDVRSTSEYSNMVNAVVDAEGGGYGVSVSAGFSYLKKSKVTTSSISFFIGATQETQVDTVRNPLQMKLTPAARALLEDDPVGFTDQYGLRYISDVILGGSFMGSVTINSKESSESDDMSVFAELSVTQGLFSAGGSAKFEQANSHTNGQVSVSADASWQGGKDVPIHPNPTPENMGTAFTAWQESLSANPVPLKIVTRYWIDSQEVQEILNTKPPKFRAMFTPTKITWSTTRILSQENAQMFRLASSVELALSWQAAHSNWTLEDQLIDLKWKAAAHQEQLDTLNEARVVLRQSEIKSGNRSWFIARALLKEYKRITDPYAHPLPGGQWRESAKKYYRVGDTLIAELKATSNAGSVYWRHASVTLKPGVAYMNSNGHFAEETTKPRECSINLDGRYNPGDYRRYVPGGHALDMDCRAGTQCHSFDGCKSRCNRVPECRSRGCEARFVPEDNRCFCKVCVHVDRGAESVGTSSQRSAKRRALGMTSALASSS